MACEGLVDAVINDFLGEVVGAHNGFGIDGFAPEVEFGVVAIDIDAWPDVPDYFLEAVTQLEPGDVWLIELQMYPPGRDATPMEYLQVNYDVIWTSCWGTSSTTCLNKSSSSTTASGSKARTWAILAP